MIVDPYDVGDRFVDSRAIAVVGASTHAAKAGYYVPEYLFEVGYRVIPVNPTHLGTELWGEHFRASLSEIDAPVDLVNIFRRSRDVAGHVEDILSLEPAPNLVWLQQGIRDENAAMILDTAGIDVVQDACLMVAHRIYTRS